MKKIDSSILGTAAEYCVASELGRRNIYSQLTFGNRKRTDILVESEKQFLRIEVKAKQGYEWPNCKGIYGEDSIIVFVDFKEKKENERPDFYILNSKDWKNIINTKLKERITKGEVKIDSNNVPIWINQTKNGKQYEGMGVKPSDIEKFKEKWDKILTKISANP